MKTKPAFPEIQLTTEMSDTSKSGEKTVIYHEPGMTLFQYYAGQALAGVLAHPNRGNLDDIEKFCCDMARDMILELERREKNES